jgi:hypothetical protein
MPDLPGRAVAALLTSERRQLVNGVFDVERMIQCVEEALLQSVADGYYGSWATGDITWEMGSAKDHLKVAEYEWRLEELLHAHPQFCGICQYHADTLPAEVMRQGMMVHPTIFVSKPLSKPIQRPSFFVNLTLSRSGRHLTTPSLIWRSSECG